MTGSLQGISNVSNKIFLAHSLPRSSVGGNLTYVIKARDCLNVSKQGIWYLV